MDDFFDQLARNNRAAALFARPRVPTPRLSGFDAASAVVDTFTYLGFDERHVDAAAVAGERLDPIEVVTGHLDPDLTSQALGRCTGLNAGRTRYGLTQEPTITHGGWNPRRTWRIGSLCQPLMKMDEVAESRFASDTRFAR